MEKVEQHKARFYIGDKGRVITDANEMQPGGIDQDQMRLEYWMSKQIGVDLMKHYPGRQWSVDCDSRGQTIVISCPSLSQRMGYRLHMKRDNMAQLLPRCRHAAAEILERFNVTRGRIIDPQTLEAFPRDARGDAISPDGTEKSAVQKFNRDR